MAIPETQLEIASAHSQAHLQFAQAKAHSKNCKRVCLSNPKDRDKMNKVRTHNTRYKTLGFRWLIKQHLSHQSLL